MQEAIRKAHKRKLYNGFVIFRMTLRNILKARRTIFLALLSATPIALAVLFLLAKYSHDVGTSGFGFFASTMGTIQLRGILLILTVFYGSTVFSDEIDRKTLIYIQSRPVSQSVFILGKYMSAFLLTAVLLVLSTFITYLLLTLTESAGYFYAGLSFLAKDILVMLLGSAAYVAFMMFLAFILKKPVLWGLLFALGWENVVVNIPGPINKLTLLHYIQSIFPHPVGTNAAGILAALNPAPSSVQTSVTVLIAITFAFIFLSWFFYRIREYKLN